MEEIFRITKDVKQSISLKELAADRLKDIRKLDKPYKIVEEYYEIIKEIVTAIMYAEGWKTLSHKALFTYLQNNHKQHFSEGDFRLMDKLRVTRNDLMYYGKRVDEAFLINNEARIKIVIDKLFTLLNSKLR